jgi:hypothetical protein
MSIDNYNYSDISKVLNAVQYFGDLNPKLLGAIIGVKEATGIMETLRKKSTFSVTFFARERIMGLRRYFVSLKIPPTLISLVDYMRYSTVFRHLLAGILIALKIQS